MIFFFFFFYFYFYLYVFTKKTLKNHKTWVDSQPQTASGRLGLSLRGQDLSWSSEK